MFRKSLQIEPYCPITRLLLRHPVEASDGNIYEAEALLEWFKSSKKIVSPMTHEKLLSLAYDELLKEKIDYLCIGIEYEDERYDDYQIQDVILELQLLVANKLSLEKRHFSLSKSSIWFKGFDNLGDNVLDSLLIANNVFLFSVLLAIPSSVLDSELDWGLFLNHGLKLSIISGAGDFGVRYLTNGHGIFSRHSLDNIKTVTKDLLRTADEIHNDLHPV